MLNISRTAEKTMYQFIEDITQYSTPELEKKVYEMSRKMTMTSNRDLIMQLRMLIDLYREEIEDRRKVAIELMKKERAVNFNKYINIDNSGQIR